MNLDRRISVLSSVPESAIVRQRLYFTVIGLNSWRFAHDIFLKNVEVFPGLTSLSRTLREKTAAPISLRLLRGRLPKSSEYAPYTYKILLERTPHEVTGHSRGPSLITQSCATEGSSAHQECVLIKCYPVEKFREEVSVCRSIHRWKSSCIIFLADCRAGSEVFPDLVRRKLELDCSINRYMHQAHMLPENVPSLLAIVLQHSPSCATNDDTAKVSHDDLPESDRWQRFVRDVREMQMMQSAEMIHFQCDFNDLGAVWNQLYLITSKVVKLRTTRTTARLKELPDTLAASRGKRCCAIM